MDASYVLRTPWYALARAGTAPFEPAARSPSLQKYDTADFAERLLADPSASLAYGPEDRWTLPTGGEPFRTDLRKLYQPHHDRFYALVIELFCAEPGLPLPADTDALELGFVIRRRRMVPEGDPDAFRRLGKEIVRDSTGADAPLTEGLDLAAGFFPTRKLTPVQADLLRQARPRLLVEAWTASPQGRSSWTELPTPSIPAFAEHEQAHPMWRIPPTSRSRPRSLWFGVIPTSSADRDDTGAWKFDEQAEYRILCYARRQIPGRPPRHWWSTYSEPYRLAPAPTPGSPPAPLPPVRDPLCPPTEEPR